MDHDDLTMITDGLDRILIDAPLEAIDHAVGKGEEAEALWSTLAEAGYPMLCVGEEHGGFGAGLAQATSIAILAARQGLAMPLADSVLANGLLSRAGAEPQTMRIAIADPIDPAAPVPHALQAEAVLLFEQGALRLARLDPAQLSAAEGREDGAAGMTRAAQDTLTHAVAPDWLCARTLRALGALMRAASMAGAMQATLDLTLGYTQEREQFGRALSKFQAIQHHLSDIACETAASLASVEQASDALDTDPDCGQHTLEEIAIAKTRCGEAVDRVTAAAHQAHGAMGFTYEYALGRFTRRLWQWQDEFGSQSEWAIWLGHAVLTDSDPALWSRISRDVEAPR